MQSAQTSCLHLDLTAGQRAIVCGGPVARSLYSTPTVSTLLDQEQRRTSRRIRSALPLTLRNRVALMTGRGSSPSSSSSAALALIDLAGRTPCAAPASAASLRIASSALKATPVWHAIRRGTTALSKRVRERPARSVSWAFFGAKGVRTSTWSENDLDAIPIATCWSTLFLVPLRPRRTGVLAMEGRSIKDGCNCGWRRSIDGKVITPRFKIRQIAGKQVQPARKLIDGTTGERRWSARINM